MTVAARAGALSNNGLTAATTNIPVVIPAGAVAGDLALFAIGCNNNNTMTTVPAGWAALASSPVFQSTIAEGFLYYKFLDSTDPGATRTFVLGGSQRPVGVLEVFSGVDAAQFLRNTADVVSGKNVASTSIIAPAVTTRVDQSWVVNFWTARVASTTAGPTLTVPGTHTALGFSATAFATAGVQDSVRAGRLTTPGAAGSFGTYTATAGSSASYVCFSVPLPPGPQGIVRVVPQAVMRSAVM